MTTFPSRSAAPALAKPWRWFGALVAASVAVSSSACLLAFPHDFHVDGAGGAGGEAPACAVGVLACVAPSDCPDTGNPCVLRTCDMGCCGMENAAADSVAATGQTAGDCTTKLCDGTGQVQFVNDDSDLPPAQDDCHVPTCSQGSPLQKYAQPGTMCAMGRTCDEKGHCVECESDTDCPSNLSCNSAKQCVSSFICNLPVTSSNVDCDTCLTAHCCPPINACIDDATCLQSCLMAGGMMDPNCTNAATAVGALYTLVKGCATTSCAVCGSIF